MRHRVAFRKLGRVTDHRIAMLRNQATALFRYEHLTTTVPRAKELRPFVERLITIAKRGAAGSDRDATGAATNGDAKNGRLLTARRLVMRDLQDREVVAKLFDSLAPRFAARPGGYTRLLRLGYRRGDSAEVAQVELIGSEFDPKAKAEADKEDAAKPKAKGVGGRLRAAAERLRGKKDAEPGDLKEKAPRRSGAAKIQRPKKQGAK
ncbi:MAG TPA: 50S ribosomal protein L17 [Vicinamibacterales bacterium]|nr:50S ribosomal protein L17 [Vicinamibacterales bacterium]